MKQHEHQYVTGMITGGIVAFLCTLMAYSIANMMTEGISIATMLILTVCSGMLVGAAFSYLVTQAEEGPHFQLKR